MRERKVIEKEAEGLKFIKDILTLEVLLDIRELLASREARETLKHLRGK